MSLLSLWGQSFKSMVHDVHGFSFQTPFRYMEPQSPGEYVYLRTRAPSGDSDQPAHWRSLIKIFTTVLSTSLGKNFFAWRLILNESILFLSDTVCRFCFCLLFSNMYSKIKFTAKNWYDRCNFYSKVNFFFNFCLRKYFCFSLLNLNCICFTTILWKFPKIHQQNLLKIWLQFTYLSDFCISCIQFYYEKKWKYLIFLNPMTRKTNVQR